jgi:hypothetical protein
MSPAKPISMTTTQASNGLSPTLRNNIYTALLSGHGIRNIESSLDESLAASGFKDRLREYITELYRSGQATTAEEARSMAMARIRVQMEESETKDKKDKKKSNGVNGTHEEDGAESIDLRVPEGSVQLGTRTVMRELERVCEIEYAEK